MKKVAKEADLSQRRRNGGLFCVAGLVGATGLAGMALMAPSVLADTSAVDSVSITIPSACTMGGTVASGDEHITTMMSGQYKEGIGKTTLTAFCNDQNGFVIYAVGGSDDETGNTDLISNIGSNYNIPTGVYTQGTTTDSVWSMKLTALSGTYSPTIATGYDSYHAVPNSYTTVAYRNPDDHGGDAATDAQGGEGSSLETTYAVYTSGVQPAGTYVGKVRYAMLHPYTTSTLISLEKAFYNAGKSKVTVGGKSYYAMQDMSSSICDAVNIIGEASQVQLVDTRDNNLYWATKLEDGHCWMTQSLDLNLSTTTALTSENTDLTSYNIGAYVNGYSESGGVISWRPASGTFDAKNGDFSTWSDTQTTPQSWDTGVYYENGAYHNSSNCNYLTSSCPYFSQTPFATNGTHGAVGNYYNWTVAIASNDSSSLTSNTAGDVTNNPQNSICPKGWRLPTVSNQSNTIDGSTDEFARLNYLYNNNLTGAGDQGRDKGLFTAPLYFTRAGYVRSGALNYPGSSADYWSSTVLSSTNARSLGFNSTNVYPENNDYRYYGRSVRCVAR